MGEKEKPQSVKDKHFEELRKGILEELLTAIIHLNTIAGFLDAPKPIKAIMDIYDYNVFFFYTEWAHIKMLCISLYNVTKYYGNTNNFPRLLNYISSHKTLSKQYPLNDINAFKCKLKSHPTFLKKVYDLRNKVYAHNQSNSGKIDILLGELRDGCQLLLPDLQGIYNNLSDKYDGSRVLFQTPSGINIAKLLTDLTEYKEIKRIDRKRYLNG